MLKKKKINNFFIHQCNEEDNLKRYGNNMGLTFAQIYSQILRIKTNYQLFIPILKKFKVAFEI